MELKQSDYALANRAASRRYRLLSENLSARHRMSPVSFWSVRPQKCLKQYKLLPLLNHHNYKVSPCC